MHRHATTWRIVVVLSSVVAACLAVWLFVEDFPDSRLRWVWVAIAVTSLKSAMTTLRLLVRREAQS